MAHVLPVLIALILNCFGYHIFLTPIHYPVSPFMSGLIFAISVYFTIIEYELYPPRLRRIPLTLIQIYEFFGSLLLLEFTNSIAWFPLETFCFISLMKLGNYVRVYLNPSNKSRFINYIICFFQHPKTGIFVSYFLSISALLITLHGTYIADFKLIREGRFKNFFDEIFSQFSNAVKKMINIELSDNLVRRKSNCKRRPKKSKCHRL